MTITHEGHAPYAPAQTVIDIIEGYRDRGYATPFTTDVLVRAGVGEGLVNRVLQALKLLDLIDEQGHPTAQFEALKQARGEEEYKARLQEWLRTEYAEILQFADPATDSSERLSEAFRGCSPTGQRSRMVTLMVGLFKHAGLVPEGLPRAAPKRRLTSPKRAGVPKAPKTQEPSSSQRDRPVAAAPASGTPSGLPPALLGLLQQIPSGDRPRWTPSDRERFMAAFTAVLDFSVDVVAASTLGADAATEDPEDEDAA